MIVFCKCKNPIVVKRHELHFNYTKVLDITYECTQCKTLWTISYDSDTLKPLTPEELYQQMTNLLIYF